MSGPVGKVLIIGGGFSGMSAAIELRKRSIDVDLVEIDPDWRSYGAGISLGGATLRAFRTIGILDEFLKQGNAADGVHVRLPNGMPLATLPTPHLAGPDVPGGGAIMRPALAKILAAATRATGANVILGETFQSISPASDGVKVELTNGTTGNYDLVVGADGLFSKVRQTVFPDAPMPAYTGQGVWRAVIDRPPGVETTMMWIGPKVKVGINPVSRTQAYVFITEDSPTKHRMAESEYLAAFSKLLEQFTAQEVVEFRKNLGAKSQIVYRPLEGLLLPRPWHKDRVVLIGDAAHATTPHLAAGACIGIEDAIVLAEELERAADVESGLHAFENRRWERCRMVVENSLRLGQIEIHDGDKQEHALIMRQSMMALAAPI